MQSVGDSFRAIRDLAKQAHQVTSREQSLCEQTLQELAHEAQKFLIYRAWRYRDRQLLALQRMRALVTRLREQAE